MTRRESKTINVGGVLIGGNNPVSVQSMTTAGTADVSAALAQIHELKSAGCDIVRVAVEDDGCVEGLKSILPEAGLPVVADIQFDYRLAIKSAKAGVHKLRINPGNIGGQERVKEIAACAADLGIPIRVGVNSGSVDKDILDKFGGLNAQSLTESALLSAGMLETCGFYDICVSVKASDTRLMIEAYELIARRCEYPLHLGVTEAGTAEIGVIKNAVGIGSLLTRGIGDTIRVSLTGNPVKEVRAAKDILKAVGLNASGLNIISCPTCGRCATDIESVVNALADRYADVSHKLNVAVMGCAVNGPGEASHADIGVACGKDGGLIFKKGKAYKKVSAGELLGVICEEIDAMIIS